MMSENFNLYNTLINSEDPKLLLKILYIIDRRGEEKVLKAMNDYPTSYLKTIINALHVAGFIDNRGLHPLTKSCLYRILLLFKLLKHYIDILHEFAKLHKWKTEYQESLAQKFGPGYMTINRTRWKTYLVYRTPTKAYYIQDQDGLSKYLLYRDLKHRARRLLKILKENVKEAYSCSRNYMPKPIYALIKKYRRLIYGDHLKIRA